MSGPNYYQMLGVSAGASAADLRVAYARLVRRHHPDVAGELPGRLQEIQQAYHCLADPERRAAHDRALAAAEATHAERQRRIQRRLDRYDRRHPVDPRPRWRRWLPLFCAGAAAALLAWSLVELFGAEAG